jgi:hypothetical protein
VARQCCDKIGPLKLNCFYHLGIQAGYDRFKQKPWKENMNLKEKIKVLEKEVEEAQIQYDKFCAVDINSNHVTINNPQAEIEARNRLNKAREVLESFLKVLP